MVMSISATLMVILHELPRFNFMQFRPASHRFDLSFANNYFQVCIIIYKKITCPSLSYCQPTLVRHVSLTQQSQYHSRNC